MSLHDELVVFLGAVTGPPELKARAEQLRAKLRDPGVECFMSCAIVQKLDRALADQKKAEDETLRLLRETEAKLQQLVKERGQ